LLDTHEAMRLNGRICADKPSFPRDGCKYPKKCPTSYQPLIGLNDLQHQHHVILFGSWFSRAPFASPNSYLPIPNEDSVLEFSRDVLQQKPLDAFVQFY
ncbi:hypothetical protein ACTXT7_017607, partial [Hymenolepis weldensis]